VLGYPIIDRQKLPDRHVLPLWLIVRIPELDHRFFPLIGDSTAVHRVVGDFLDFRNMIPSGNKRCFIKLKDKLLIGFGGAQIFLKTPGCWFCYCCCSNPGLRPLWGKVLRFDPRYLELFDSYGYSPIRKTSRAALGCRIFARFARLPIVTLEFPFLDPNSRALAIDKTGTITEGCPQVMRLRNAAWEQTSDGTGHDRRSEPSSKQICFRQVDDFVTAKAAPRKLTRWSAAHRNAAKLAPRSKSPGEPAAFGIA
jgi:hypothetical protein